MSKSGPHDECERRQRELEATLAGLAVEIARLNDLVERSDHCISMVIMTLDNLTKRLKEKE